MSTLESGFTPAVVMATQQHAAAAVATPTSAAEPAPQPVSAVEVHKFSLSSDNQSTDRLNMGTGCPSKPTHTWALHIMASRTGLQVWRMVVGLVCQCGAIRQTATVVLETGMNSCLRAAVATHSCARFDALLLLFAALH